MNDHTQNAERKSDDKSIADERDALRAMLERAIKVLERTSNDTLDGRNTAIDARELLAQYPRT